MYLFLLYNRSVLSIFFSKMPCNRLNSLNTLSIGTRMRLGLFNRSSKSKYSCKSCCFKNIHIQELLDHIKSLRDCNNFLDDHINYLRRSLSSRDSYISYLESNCRCHELLSYSGNDNYSTNSDNSYQSFDSSSRAVVDTVPSNSTSGSLVFSHVNGFSYLLSHSSNSITMIPIDSHVHDNSSTVESSTVRIDSFIPPESFHAITYSEQ